MYQYDTFDHALVRDRVSQFRGQVARRLAGELSEEEFRPLRLMNGLYLQLHAYMLRVAIPYGTLSATQMRRLAHIARRYDRGFGHFTTRQNIQYNWPKLEEVPDLLEDLAEVEMHAIQTSGNCIRNTTSDPFAGRAADEVEDARVWCEIIRQWSTLHPEFSFLPRKFKIAVSAAKVDRAAIRVHDIGLHLHRNDAGETGFQVMVGGGLGRTPMVGKTIREFLPAEHLLSYLEAILRVYNQEGRRDNKFKARIKILVHESSPEVIREKVEAEWLAIRDEAVDLPAEEVARIRAFFAAPDWPARPDAPAALAAARAKQPAFDRWVKANVAAHRTPGYAIVTVSLKPVGGPPGDATDVQMDAIADLSERYGFGEIRVTHEQNLVLPDVAQEDLHALWLALGEQGLATANVNLVSDIIACPGLDYCALANARSIPVAQDITRRFADDDRIGLIGELKIKISGCINACGHHHVGDIGILGVEKTGEEFYQITLGGRPDDKAAIGTITGRAFAYDEVVDAVERIVETYMALRADGEIFRDTLTRLGHDPFKEALYAAD